MKLILENWSKFLSENQLDEAASATNAKAGVRRDFNAAKAQNLWDIFIEKYKDDKTPYGLYGDLDQAAQEQYKEYIQKKLKLAQAAIKVQQASEEANTPEEKEQVQQAAANVEQAIEKDDAVEDQTGLDIDAPASDPAEGGTSGEEIEIKPLLDRFFNFLTRTGVLRESIGSLIKALGAKDTKLVGSSLSKNFKREEIKALVKYLEDKENVLSFVNQYFANDPEKDQIIQKLSGQDQPAKQEPQSDEEPSDEDETEVEVGGREFTYSDEDIQTLKKAYEDFASDSEGFMKTKTLRAQEVLWIGLRNALNNIGGFRPIAGEERSLTNENLFEQDNTQKIKRLVVDLERLRKDFNDTDDTLAAYVDKAGGREAQGGKGLYEAKAYMARFLGELKDVQNSIAKAVADTKSLLNIEVNEILKEQEEETREQKIQNVRNVYETIKDLLGGILPELDRNVATQKPEVSANIQSSYDELQKIRKYFRNVGAFAKTSDMDVQEIETEYKNIKNGISKSMSRVVDDLRRNRLTPDIATPFLQRLTSIGSYIMETFGVGPDKGYDFKTIDVPSDGKQKEDIEQDTSEEGAEPISDEASQISGDDTQASSEDPTPSTPEATAEIERSAEEYYRSSESFSKTFDTITQLIRKEDDNGLMRVIGTLQGINESRLIKEEDTKEDLVDLLKDIESAIITILSAEKIKDILKRKSDFIEMHEFYTSARSKLKEIIDSEDPGNELISDLESSIEELAKEFSSNFTSEYYLKRAKGFGELAKKTEIEASKRAKAAKKAKDNSMASKIIDKVSHSLPDFFGIEDAKNIDFGAKKKPKEKTANNNSSVFGDYEPDALQPQTATSRAKSFQESKENLLERLIKEELKVLNGKKMVCN